MDVSEVVKLVASGNFKDVELAWLSYVERDLISADEVIGLKPVLEEFIKIEKRDQAGTLAWTALEALKERRTPEDALNATRVFLLLLNRNDELKALATDLYRTVYANRDGLEALMEEAGIAGGRPPRRAMRTLDTCLSSEEGSYVVDRDDDDAARIESLDTSEWLVTVGDGEKSETFEPVAFADRFTLCRPDDFRVLARFDSERLQGMLAKEPAAVVENVLREKGHKLDSDELCAILAPRIMARTEWPKWWTKARSAVRKSRNIKIEGRSPYYLEYLPDGHDIRAEFVTRFKRLESPASQYSAIEEFLRASAARQEAPDPVLLEEMRKVVSDRAKRLEGKNDAAALPERIIEAQIGAALGDEDCDGPAAALLASAEDPAELIKACDSAALWLRACDCLEKGKPDDWVEVLIGLFPSAPGPACDALADMIDGAGVGEDRIEGIITTMLLEATSCFESLCWLWDKGLDRANWGGTAPVTIVSRILSMLADIQRSDSFTRETAKAASGAARSALSARKHARFVACIKDIEPGMADALRTQIQRLHNLTRKIEDDLVNHIRARFPIQDKKAKKPRWLQEGTIYTTREGRSRFEAEINDLVNVKMRENAKAIGEAAEKGDLSENSEYKFALEERDLLRARLANMQQQAALAQTLGPDAVPTDHVAIGSKVMFKHVGGDATAELTFLGPFDANVEQRIFNYQAPFAQELMGSTVGDHVELPMVDPPGTYEVVSMAPWRTD